MGNAMCREALLGVGPNYDDYVDEDGDFDGTNYLLALLAWKMRHGATLQNCLRDRKKIRAAKKNQVNRKKKRYCSCYRHQARIISLNEGDILCVPKASTWYSQYVHTP